MKRLLIILFIGFAGSLYGQDEETRNLSSFTSVEVGEAIKVHLIKGNEESARVEASGVDLDRIKTEVSGSRLRIDMSRGNYRNANVTIWLTYRNISALSISSASSVRTQNTLKTEKLRLEVSSAGDGELEIDVDELIVNVSSSGSLDISGRTLFQDVSVSSAGRYNAYELSCEDTEVNASSSGSARVTATKSIDASASSAGNIRYKGNPEKKRTTASSGGSTKQSN
jgi:hypothetical protein